MLATISFNSGYLPKKCSRTKAPSLDLKFWYDLAVAAHRPVEALQIAIDHENEVVQLLAHRHGQRAHRLGLVHFTIAEKCPYLAVGGRHDAAMLEIAHETRLKNRRHRAQPHRYRGKLPEVRHQPGMRIGRQSI